MTVLITGGMGFTGLHTARRFLDEGQDVVLTVFRTRREPDFIKDELGKRVKVEYVDISNPYDIIEAVRKHNVEHISHLAVPGLGALSPAEDYRVNMMGLINVLEAGRIGGVKRVVLASSIAVYAGLNEGPFREDQPLPLEAHNPTEAFKKAMEVTAFHYADRTKMDIVSARLSGIWGPLYHTLASFQSRVAHAAARGKPADFSNARGGQPFEEDSGDLVYVKDAAQGLVKMQLAPSLPNRIYNIAGGTATLYKDIIAAAKKVNADTQVPVQAGKGPRSRPNQYLDISRANQDFGYQPEYPVERGMADYIEWLKTNPL
jgi:UDP-glucose 4-epimerase